MKKTFLQTALTYEYDGEIKPTFQLHDGSLPEDYYRQNGYIVLGYVEVDFPDLTEAELRAGAVAALKQQQAAIRAETEAKCTSLQSQINRLLCLEYVDPVDHLPKRVNVNVTDVGDDDIPF